MPCECSRCAGNDVPGDRYGPRYTALAARCKTRTGFHCVMCGEASDNLEAHHWAQRYPPHTRLDEEDLHPFCSWPCHELATQLRKARARGMAWSDLSPVFRHIIDIIRRHALEGLPLFEADKNAAPLPAVGKLRVRELGATPEAKGRLAEVGTITPRKRSI